MDDSLNICLSCGFCCDGTLIGFVELDSDETSILRELMDIQDTNGKGFFLQPCNNYCDGCTIYSKRPKQCTNFKCELLKTFEQKDLDFDLAIEIINVVKQKKINIEKNLEILKFELKSQSFSFKMIELKKLLQKSNFESSSMQNYLELMSDIKQLDRLLLIRFGISLY